MLRNFFFENRAVYEMKWKNIVDPERPHVTIWQKLITCWILKATNTNQVCIILFVLCNNDYKNARQYYVIRTLLILFLNYYVKFGKESHNSVCQN